MIVFKSFLRVLNKNKAPVILFTVMLVIFGVINFTSNDSTDVFTSSRPDVLIVNKDVNEGITKTFIDYISKRAEIIKLSDNESIDDALFYRNVNYVIYIPLGFRDDIINGNKPSLEVKSTGDYQASLAQMMVNKFLRVVNVYSGDFNDEWQLINYVNSTFSNETNVEITSKLDVDSLSRMATYFNFMNYTMLAGLVFVISIVMTSFKNVNISKRTTMGSMSYRRVNMYLLLSNLVFALVFWLVCMILSFVLLGDILFSLHGVMYIVNSFIFTIVSLTIALLIGNLISNKNAVNGIVNLIALGSSFLCGAFVPVEFMPKSVVNLSRVFPSYYYINSNELIKSMEVVNFESLLPVFKNIIFMLAFVVLFVILINVVSWKKRRFA